MNTKFYGWLGGWTRSRGHLRTVTRNGDRIEVGVCLPGGAGDTEAIEVILYGFNAPTVPSVAIHARRADGRSHCLYDGPLADLLKPDVCMLLVDKDTAVLALGDYKEEVSDA